MTTIENIINKQTNEIDKESRINISREIFKFLSTKNNIFITNREFFTWNGDIHNANWLSSPLDIYAENIREFTNELCDHLYLQKFKYVRSRLDFFPNITTVEVEFEIVCRVIKSNKYIESNGTYEKLYNVKINTNPFLILPYLYFEYITPKFSFESWKDNIQLEKNIWESISITENFNINKNFTKDPELKNLQKNILRKLEDRNDYLMTGEYSLFTMLNIDESDIYYPINILCVNIEELIDIIRQEVSDKNITIRSKEVEFYFWEKEFEIFVGDKPFINIMTLDYGFNFVKMNYLNHTNFHGILLYLIIKKLQSDDKNSDKYFMALIKLLIEGKSKSNELEISKFQILTDKIIGPIESPFLKYKIKEWNRELDYAYRPDKKNEQCENATS
jgi:hypothetical protein